MPSSSSSAGPAPAVVFWSPTAPPVQQVDSLTVGAVATGGVVTATVGVYPNNASVAYTCLSTDTTASAAAALQVLLAALQDGRFQEIIWTVSGAVITATAQTAGTPFTLAGSGSGGATLTRASVTLNSSPSDVGAAANWNRNNQQQLPQNGDTVIVQDSTVPLLWNLDALKAVQFGSYTRWQSFTGTIGLPEVNANGYVEYRPTYFQFVGPPGGVLTMILGQGQTGSGPQRERYNVGSQQTVLNLFGAGSPLDDYAVRFLGSNVFNVLNVYASSLGVAVLPTETAAVQTATVLNGASLTCGAGCTFSGTLTLFNSTAVLFDAPNAIVAQQGSTLTVESSGGLTYPSVQLVSGSTAKWLSDGNVSNLVLQTGSVFDKSQDARPITVSASSQDGDTTTTRDNWNAISWGSAIVFRNAIGSGPVQTGVGRTFKIV